ncbi:carnosine synthase 1 [Crotalus adamanteus]|uniref:Carnosine synthase 1 n=1 Tax=Crotalus adamanteus TaxID=8729 RepID=A0AAW1C8S5_CROAD
MLSLDQIHTEPPQTPKELDWVEQSFLPPMSPLRSARHQDTLLDSKISPEDAQAKAWTAYYYDLLQCSLQQQGLPETIDLTKEPRSGFGPSDITMCVLGSPASYLSVLLEGGNQCPGNMLLCLSPAWLSKVPSETHPGESSLYVLKAVTFELGGRTVLEEFSSPRRVSYFTGSFEPCKLQGQSAAELARDLDCPTGGSGELTHLLEDKLLTRQLMDQKGEVAVPPTLAFTFKRPMLLRNVTEEQRIHLVELSGREGQDNLLQEEITAFLQGGAMESYKQVVVKPSGWRCNGAQAVSFHDKSEHGSVLQVVLALLETLEEDESILLEPFIPTAQILRSGPLVTNNSPVPGNISLQSNLAIRICAVVCRSRKDQPLLSKVICAVGPANKPLKHQTTVPQTLERSLQHWGVKDEIQIAAIHAQIKQKAEAAMKAFMDMETSLSIEQKGGHQAQTDIIGVDFLLSSKDQVLQLVALEMNSQLCLETCSALESMGWMVGAPGGETACALMETMLRRAQCHLMEGKHVLVIGAGGFSKKFVWEAARDYGLKIHLVETDPNHFASQLVHTFIHYDTTDHTRDEEHARKLLGLIQERGLHLDGCLSYWDDCMVLTALICEGLGLRCSSSNAMRVAKQKSRTHQHLLRRCKEGSRWSSAALYAVPCCHLESHADVERAASHINFPGVMKLEYGAGAVGVKLVEDAQQCHLHFDKITQDLKDDSDYLGIGLGWGNNMLLMEYVSGTEHDVDLVIYEGRMLGAFVSDNGPTRVPNFTETAACMPTCLPPESEAQLIHAAYQCCLGCGLTDGVFNVELKLTAAGPKLIEINPRMGGFYLRDWIREIYGVDIMLASVMVACGVAPVLPTPSCPRTKLVGVMCLVSQHLQALKSTASLEILQALHERGVIRLNLLEDEIVSKEYEEPYCNVACASSSRHEACVKLLGICQVLGIDSLHYPVAYFLSHFK